jgi:hypothetical protein
MSFSGLRDGGGIRGYEASARTYLQLVFCLVS